VELGGRGQHTVQVEQCGIVLMPVHTMKIRACRASLRNNVEVRSPTAEPGRSRVIKA
jgi:hypothetical protein